VRAKRNQLYVHLQMKYAEVREIDCSNREAKVVAMSYVQSLDVYMLQMRCTLQKIK
jgi:hypothetical protein